MLRPEGADSFGRRNMLNNANEVSETSFVLCIALTPQSGDSSDAILEVPSEALLHLPHAIAALEFLPPREQSERTLEIESTYIKNNTRVCACYFYIVSQLPSNPIA